MNRRVFSCARCGTIPPLGVVRKLRRFMLSGLTKMDIDGLCVGTLDEPLCKVGIEGATEAAVNFATVCERDGDKVDLVVASPMKRATGTGAIFSNRLGGVMLTTENLLVERHLGELEGKPNGANGNIALLRNWDAPKGAISQRKFEEGVLVFVDGLWTSFRFGDYGDVLFITHNICLLTIIKIIKGWHINKMPKFVPPKSCEIKTFGIGQACEGCGGNFYEPLEVKNNKKCHGA